MGKVLSLPAFEALTDEQKDACVALAMGWEFDPDACHGEGRWRRFNADRVPLEATWRPPPYVSHAPDARDRWRWRGEMIEALCNVEGWAELSFEVPRHGGWLVTGPWTEGSAFNSKGDNLALALCRALCAAGKLEEPSE